jgi:hypothetical protein
MIKRVLGCLLIALVLIGQTSAAVVPQLGRISITARTTTGAVITSAFVNVYQQGATVNGAQSGTSPLTVTVYDIGAIAASGVVTVNTGSTVYNVTAVTETTVTLSFSGSLSLSSGDRLVSGAAPGLFRDAQGTVSTTNPMTTSSTGGAAAWIMGGYYDVLISKTGITTQLLQDVYVPGANTRLNTYPNDSAQTLFRLDAARTATWTSADVLFAIGRAATNEFTVDGVGGTHATGASEVTTGGFTVGAGGITVTGNSTIAGTLGSLTGLTVASGTVSLPAGEIGTSELAASAATAFQTEVDNTTDDTVTNTTQTLIGTTSGNDFTFTITPTGTASVIMCTLTARPSLESGAAGDVGTIRIQNTTAAATIASMKTVRQDHIADGTADERYNMTLIGYDTGRTGAQTYQGQMAGGAAAQKIHLNGDEVTARFMCVEFKK